MGKLLNPLGAEGQIQGGVVQSLGFALTEGLMYNDEGRLTVRGRASSTDGTVTTRVQRWEGTFVVGQEVDRLTADGAGLVPFTATFDLSDAPAGDYVVMSQVQTPSGAITTDTRRFTVVD